MPDKIKVKAVLFTEDEVSDDVNISPNALGFIPADLCLCRLAVSPSSRIRRRRREQGEDQEVLSPG